MLRERLKSYPDSEGRFDELFEAPQKPRAHWSRFFRALMGTSAADIHARLEAAERQIRDSGVTYNVYADPQGLDRPWDLDVLPLIIAADEWREIEAGIRQRAHLFDRVLADLYGAQVLLQQGLIPPKLLFGQSGFLRSAHAMNLPGGVHLHVYAADLARSPDGRWWVMADRTQAPSGAGYALENRLIVSRAFSTLYRDLKVERVARFFATMRDSLSHFAPKGDGPPLTVLLTPGPYNETYFEHSLLARYLGFPLVEGGDLTVRKGRVWLKTIGGLTRVHAILRRQDDTYCDPLELRSDSALGVAGLTDCARRGSVLIANALGSGVIESGALLGFLPGVCDHLTGESLRLPSIATWWCGEPAALADALRQARHLVFKTADPAHRFDPVFGEDLDEAGLAALAAMLEVQPERFIAQEFVHVSQAPVLAREQPFGISARGVGLRVFAIRSPSGYVVMPGGLTRVASDADERVVSAQRGGGSKDTWVISSRSVDAKFTLLRSTVTAADLVHSGSGIPSRVAENLFWFGRYEERCEDSARLLRVALNEVLRENDDDEDSREPVIALARAFMLIDEDETPESALLAAATQETSPYGLPSNLRNLEQVAFQLRERISTDNWRTISLLVKDPVIGRTVTLADALDWLDRSVTGLMTLSGFALDGMTRDDGWRFMSIGRRLERLAFQCLALQVALQHGRANALTWLLRLADSTITYRSRYMARPEWLPLLDLLVLDSTNPRSVRFQADGVLSYLKKLEDAYGSCGSELLRPCIDAMDGLVPARDLQPQSDRLRDAIDALRATAFALSDGLSHRFFTHAQGYAWAPLSG